VGEKLPMNITGITCTGDRPECMSLLLKWITRQTKQLSQWIIIDDGKVPLNVSNLPEYVHYYRREPQITDPSHTLIMNLCKAFTFVFGDAVLFIEDDEYYSPKYVETMDSFLSNYPIVGICFAKYYFLPTAKWAIIGNHVHASLAQTGIQTSFISEVNEVLEGNPYLDMRIWAKAKGRGYLFNDGNTGCLYLGMKGMPGRKGIGTGHNGLSRYYKPDIQLKNLYQWIGKENADIYQKYILSGRR
jgi:hypothetical protein